MDAVLIIFLTLFFAWLYLSKIAAWILVRLTRGPCSEGRVLEVVVGVEYRFVIFYDHGVLAVSVLDCEGVGGVFVFGPLFLLTASFLVFKSDLNLVEAQRILKVLWAIKRILFLIQKFIDLILKVFRTKFLRRLISVGLTLLWDYWVSLPLKNLVAWETCSRMVHQRWIFFFLIPFLLQVLHQGFSLVLTLVSALFITQGLRRGTFNQVWVLADNYVHFFKRALIKLTRLRETDWA